MKMHLAAIGLGVLFASCAPMTPQARIAANPEKFAALPAKEQELVQQGQIARGMSKDGVTLSWGVPGRTFAGYENSKRSERWDYTGSRPVYLGGYFGGYGYSPGYYGAGYALGPEVAYIPYRLASVWFLNERVSSWEQLRTTTY